MIGLLMVMFCLVSASYGKQRRAVTSDKSRLWEDGVIPYSINQSYDGNYKRLFQAAMLHWMERTCLTFQRYDRLRHSDYIHFTPDKCGCCSHVGRKGGGAQIISIGERCDKLGIVVHEIGHVVGFWHEHTRPDRDDFVEILRENIFKGQDYNFDKAKANEIDSLHETYDYHSIMHYARDTFSRQKGLDTIRPKGIYSDQMAPFIGQRIELSRGDIRQTNKLYHCPRCFQTFTSETGQLYTDGDCTDFVWRIVTSEGQRTRINLTLSKIFSNYTDDCDHNTNELLRVRMGGSLKSSVVKEYCNGRDELITFTSYSSRTILELRSQKRPGKVLIGHFDVDCGGLLQGSHGLLESPNFPNPYSGGLLCLWVLRVPAGYRVAVQFNYFQLESQKDCLYDRLDIFETHQNKTQELGTICGSAQPATITSQLSNEIVIKFSTDQSIHKNGFQLEYFKEIDECLSGANKCEHKCRNEIGGYRCECYSGYRLADDEYSCLKTCGGVITSREGVITTPNWPDNYDADSNCIWELEAPEDHMIFLTIHNYSIEGLNSECSYDSLKINKIEIDHQNETFIKLCGEDYEPLHFRSSFTSLTLEFNSDSSMQKLGFYASYKFDMDECKTTSKCSHLCENSLGSYVCSCPEGMVLKEDKITCKDEKCMMQINEANGVIRTGGYDKRECFYHMITTPGHQLVLTFLDFHFDADASCSNDHVDVYDGADLSSSNLIGKLCGDTIPPTLTSTANELLLAVYLNISQPEKGFNATFSSKCGGHITVERSPGYIYSHTNFGDSKYPPSMDCRWELSKSSMYISETTVIRLTFKHFFLESDENCNYDYIEIAEREEAYGNWTVKRKVCGKSNVNPVFSTKKHLMLRFVTDRTYEEKGFVIEYSMIDLTDDVITSLDGTEDGDKTRNLVVYE